MPPVSAETGKKAPMHFFKKLLNFQSVEFMNSHKSLRQKQKRKVQRRKGPPEQTFHPGAVFFVCPYNQVNLSALQSTVIAFAV